MLSQFVSHSFGLLGSPQKDMLLFRCSVKHTENFSCENSCGGQESNPRPASTHQPTHLCLRFKPCSPHFLSLLSPNLPLSKYCDCIIKIFWSDCDRFAQLLDLPIKRNFKTIHWTNINAIFPSCFPHCFVCIALWLVLFWLQRLVVRTFLQYYWVSKNALSLAPNCDTKT